MTPKLGSELCLKAVYELGAPRNAAKGIGAANPWLCVALAVKKRHVQDTELIFGHQVAEYGIDSVYLYCPSMNVFLAHVVRIWENIDSTLPRPETRPYAAAPSGDLLLQ